MVRITSIFNCDCEKLFNEIKKTRSLFYIAKPLIKFVHRPYSPLPERWEEGKYHFKMYLLGCIPLGTQWIVMSIDESNMCLIDNGYSRLIKNWDHKFFVEKIGNKKTLYVDEINIRAGILTPFIVLFGNRFFRIRQRNWKKLINNGLNYEK